MSFLRPPSNKIRAWNEHSLDAACTAQIMYMAGLIEDTFSRPAFDQTVGKVAGMQDTAGCSRIMLENGFHILCIAPCSLEDMLDDNKLAKVMKDQGCEDENIEFFLKSNDHTSARKRTMIVMDLLRQFNETFVFEVWEPTPQDTLDFINNGGVISCLMPEEFYPILLIPSHPGDSITLYDPKNGIHQYDSKALWQLLHDISPEGGYEVIYHP